MLYYCFFNITLLTCMHWQTEETDAKPIDEKAKATV